LASRMGKVGIVATQATPISVKGKTALHCSDADIRLSIDESDMDGTQVFVFPAASATGPFQFDAGKGMTLWVMLDSMLVPSGDIYYWTQIGE